LFGLIPCPRHRLPRLNRATGNLEPSLATFERQPRRLVKCALETLELLRLVRLTRDENDKRRITHCTNLTLFNMWLVMFGPKREDVLARQVVLAQVACGICALVVRHTMALYVFAEDNRGYGSLKLPGGLAATMA
ncbi:3-isopropylmalate dehydratase, partial [Ascosphaera atra]